MEFSFVRSRDIKDNVTIRIYCSTPLSLLEVHFVQYGKEFYNQLIKTNEWNVLPILISHLHSSAQLIINDSSSRKWIYPFFSGVLMNTGRYKLTTPAPFDNALKQYEQGIIPKNPWLDPIVFKLIKNEQIKVDPNPVYLDTPILDVPVLYDSDMGITLVKKPPWIEDNNAENIIELKHRKLARGGRHGPWDKDLKPNAKVRDESLTVEEETLIWKFRHHLKRDKAALTKFVRCVMWHDVHEATQAEALLGSWEEMDVADSLELLSRDFPFRIVREFAVKQLERADDEYISGFLLQLVQALRYEEEANRNTQESEPGKSALVTFLCSRAQSCFTIAHNLSWYLAVESADKMMGHWFSKIRVFLFSCLDDPTCTRLERQKETVGQITNLANYLRQQKLVRTKKISLLESSLADPVWKLNNFDHPVPFMLDPKVVVTGIKAESATVFKSSLMPLLLHFQSETEEYPIIFKVGDDLRQDQDLKLTPYKVLATSAVEGLIEYIPSKTMASVLSEYGSIQTFFKKHHPDKSNSPDSFGIDPNVMDVYVKSCAGYSVITYLLGIGDRHLDNIMLTDSGNLFHIDFGFILGRDPKPFPPPMKLCKEMVEAFGGTSAQSFQKFKSLCFVAFTILRKNASLIINLFSLMADAAIPDIECDPASAVLKVQEKFRLDETEEEAVQFFDSMIQESVSALFPQMMETIHKWAQYWRK